MLHFLQVNYPFILFGLGIMSLPTVLIGVFVPQAVIEEIRAEQTNWKQNMVGRCTDGEACAADALLWVLSKIDPEAAK